MTIFVGLMLMFAAALLYLAVNVAAILLFERIRPTATRAFQEFAAHQLRPLSRTRIWTVGCLQLTLLLCVLLQSITEQSLLSFSASFAFYVLAVCAINISLVWSMPITKRLWREPAAKVFVWGVPIALAYIAKGYAAVWIGEVAGVSATNTPAALFAATALLLFIIVAAVLSVLALAVEISFLTFLLLGGPTTRRQKSLIFLGIATFISTYAASHAALTLPGGKLGPAILAAITFEFDASTASACTLTAEERQKAATSEPLIRALYLSTNQEKALLIERSPSLFREFVYRSLSPGDASKKGIKSIRVAKCFEAT